MKKQKQKPKKGGGTKQDRYFISSLPTISIIQFHLPTPSTPFKSKHLTSLGAIVSLPTPSPLAVRDDTPSTQESMGALLSLTFLHPSFFISCFSDAHIANAVSPEF